jgi:hypothetical protein
VRRATLAPFALLVGYGVAFGAAALGTSLLAFDDHPGQLYRVWHVVTRGWAPWAWNPGWWAGYPELQFYPPGFPYAAALLHHASLGALSVPASYQTMLWLAYLAPGVTAWLALTRVLGDGWLALPGAFVALTLAAGVASGVEGGVRWGMVSARLGWALLPLLVVAVAGWSARPRRAGGAAAALLVAIVLFHPAHLPTALAVVALGAVAAGRAAMRDAAATLAVAALGTAFWTLPLLARLDNARPLAWGSLSAREAAEQPLALALVGLALLALSRAPAGPAAGHQVVARLPWVALAVVLGDALVAEPLGVRWLPANRVVDGAWLAFALAGGSGTAVAIAWAARRWRIPRPPLALAAVAALVVLSLPGRTLALWPRSLDWPAYEATARGLRLDAFWRALHALPDGRVLFVRSAVPLVYGTAWYRPHTHVTSLTPLAAGRPIVHGTFTHPSPVAALVYRGSAARGPITRLAEQLDGESLFGRPLADLDGPTFRGHADALGVSVLAALDDDAPALRTLLASGELARRVDSPPFVLYARSAAPPPREVSRDRWQVELAGAAGQWVSARVAYYPLWRAELDGMALPVRRGARGELEVRLPQPRATVEMRYAAGFPERAGLVVSALAAVAGLAMMGWRRPGAHASRRPT